MFDSVRRLVLLAAAPATLLALAAAPAHGGTTGPAAVPAVDTSGPTTSGVLGDEVFVLTNEERLRNGCPELAEEQELAVVSVRQSHYMAATGDFGHFGWRGSTFRSRSQAAGYPAVAGENIAYGFASATEVMAAWMASPTHRANILNCEAKALGTGVQRAANGTHYWTQVFGWQ